MYKYVLFTLSESIISIIWSLRYFVNKSTELKLAFFIKVISFSAFVLNIYPNAVLISILLNINKNIKKLLFKMLKLFIIK